MLALTLQCGSLRPTHSSLSATPSADGVRQTPDPGTRGTGTEWEMLTIRIECLPGLKALQGDGGRDGFPSDRLRMQMLLLQIPRKVDEAQDYRLLAGLRPRCQTLFPLFPAL